MPKNASGGTCSVVEVTEQIAKNKKSKDVYNTEVTKHICSLLNGDGGGLKVECSETLQANTCENIFTDLIRTVEQKVYEIANYETTHTMKTQVCYPRYVLFSIEPSTHLSTVNYNLCVPTETQVMSLPPKEPISTIIDIIERRVPETKIENGSHFKNFVLKDCMFPQLRESKTVQLKMLKAEPSKCVSLAHRITSKSNRLPHLVSAFANHKGGHIYIGIDSSTYTVEGIHVQEPELHRIRNKVSKTLTKMIWPEHSKPPQQGDQWDICFEPVNDREGHRMSNTYVIVIYVAPCLGGVFVDEPESYHIVEGNMERMSFKVWKEKLQASKSPEHYKQQMIRSRRSIDIPQHGPESTTGRKYLNLSEYLQRLRKEGDWRTFDSFTSKTVGLQNPAVIPLVAYEQTLAAHMKKEYAKAAKYLAEFSKSSRYAVSTSRFEVQEIYLNAVLSRSNGRYEESYNLAKEGLEKNKLQEDDLTTGWFYSLIGSLATILATQVDSNDELVKEAREFNEKALGVVERLYGNSTASDDLKQAVYINMALLSLNSSIKGLNDRTTPDMSRIIDAQDYLTAAQRPCVGARTTAEYNSCMSLLAESDLQYRLFQHYPSYSLPHIKSAVTLATKARDIARSKKFLELLDYSLTRLGFLTEELLNQKLKNGTKYNEQKCILQELTLEKT